jgi:hypothetical protein
MCAHISNHFSEYELIFRVWKKQKNSGNLHILELLGPQKMEKWD